MKQRLSSKRLVGMPWFAPRNRRTEDPAEWLAPLFGLVIAAGLYLLGYHRLAVIVAVVSVASTLVFAWSPSGKRRLKQLLAFLSLWAGRIVSIVILTPIYLLLFPIARVYNRVSGYDPLLLRTAEAQTFWLPSDTDRRKIRYIRSMFCPEARSGRRRFFLPLALLLVAFFGLAEIGLRFFGFGDPVLYLNDATAGYYPKPNQSVKRTGGRIHINNFGMRAPDVSVQKPPGVLRILMIGDSTLYGGSYIGDDELYARLLEKNLSQALRGRRIEILNIGVNAWGPFHELGYVQKFGSFNADIAVICGPIADLRRPLHNLEPLPLFPASAPPSSALEEVFYYLVWRYRTYKVGDPISYSAGSFDIRYQQGLDAYAQLVQLLKQNGAEVFFEILPDRNAGLTGQTADADKVHIDALTKAMQAQAVPVDYPEGLFAKSVNAAVYHDDGHLDRLGHRIYSDYLTQRLLTLSSKLKTAGAITR